jgi:hypothetical protein
MIIQKHITGFVVQSFDTATQQYVRQEFVETNHQDPHWEDNEGNFLDMPLDEPENLPTHMVQP